MVSEEYIKPTLSSSLCIFPLLMEYHKMFPGVLILAAVYKAAMGFDFGLSTKCVAIPQEMAMCREISFSEMRLPNLMGHTSLAEAIAGFSKWEILARTGCHPNATTFFCSLLAPMCLDRFIHPCRSMCTAVQKSCAPILKCQGHPWPSVLNCDRFPSDEDSCLVSLHDEYKPLLTGFPKPTCQTCPRIREAFKHKRILGNFCAKHFAVKVKLSGKVPVFSLQEDIMDCQVEVMNQEGMLLPYDACHAIGQWFLINENCTQQMIHPHHTTAYVVVATSEESNIFVSHVYHWQRWGSELTLAMRRLIQRTALQCEVCMGLGHNCTGEMETCPPDHEFCGITVFESEREEVKVNGVVKNCVPSSVCGAGSADINLGKKGRSRTTMFCCKDNACNRAFVVTLPRLDTKLNGLQCPACYSSSSDSCRDDTVDCVGAETHCIDLAGYVHSGGTSEEVAMKGCATEAVCAATVGGAATFTGVSSAITKLECRAATSVAGHTRPTGFFLLAAVGLLLIQL